MDKLIEYLTIANPLYDAAVDAGRSVRGIPKFLYNFSNIYGGISIPRGCLPKLQEEIEKAGIKKYALIDNRKKFDYLQIDSPIDYRPYQMSHVIDLIAYEEGLLIAPPGSGKTIIGLSIVAALGQPTLWITHTNRLAKQAKERAQTSLPSLSKEDYGFLGAGKWKLGNVFTIGLVQTLVSKREELKSLYDQFGLVIVDEAHHCPAATFLKVINQLNPYYLYGLTATPYRRDKLEEIMFQTLGPARTIIGVKEVEKHGGIVIPAVRYRTIRSPRRIETNNAASIITNHVVDNKKRNTIITSDVVREASTGNFCLVVSDRKRHCEILHELILPGWPKTGIATGDYSSKYQDEQVRRFYDGEITVLVTTFALLGEGFDVDFMNRVFITTPFRAEGKVEQLVGRIQRSAKGKEDAIVYDYVDVDIGILKDQFFSSRNDSRSGAYSRLGLNVEPYD